MNASYAFALGTNLSQQMPHALRSTLIPKEITLSGRAKLLKPSLTVEAFRRENSGLLQNRISNDFLPVYFDSNQSYRGKKPKLIMEIIKSSLNFLEKGR